MANIDDREDQDAPDRRKFLGKASKAAMVAGIAGGYGGFAAISLRYLYPTNTDDRLWLFVIETNRMRVGESIRYRGPSAPGMPGAMGGTEQPVLLPLPQRCF
jgi:hypothetical protein